MRNAVYYGPNPFNQLLHWYMFQNVCLLLLLEEHGRYLYYVERVQRPCPADRSFTTPDRIWGISIAIGSIGTP